MATRETLLYLTKTGRTSKALLTVSAPNPKKKKSRTGKTYEKIHTSKKAKDDHVARIKKRGGHPVVETAGLPKGSYRVIYSF